MNKPILNILLASLAACAVNSSPALAQSYPVRPITMVVPFPAGSPTDVAARIAATILGDALKQTVVVDYKTGASGSIASRYVANAAPDGYTLLFTSASTHVSAPALNKALPYDVNKDFVAISPIAKTDIVVVGSPKLQWRTLGEVVKYVKENPGKVSYGSSGEGSVLHLSGAFFQSALGSELLHVPYRGAVPATVDLLGGQVDLMFDTVSNASPNIKAGKLHPYAVLSPQRSSILPEIPSSVELGFEQLQVPAVWLGLMGPAGLPKDIVETLSKAVQQGAQRKDILERLTLASMQPDASSSEAFAKRNLEEQKIFNDLVQKTGMKLGGN